MFDDTPFKRCRKCGIPKCFSQFGKNKSKKDGLQNYCLQCRKEYYAANKEKAREYARRNKEKIKSRMSAWRINNKERIREYNREYQLKHSSVLIEKRREYRRINHDRLTAYALKYRANNRTVYTRSESKRRAKMASGSYTTEEIRDLFKRQKGKCYYCQCKLINPDTKKGKGKKAHLDHVIPLNRGGRNDLSNLVWACQHCNSHKHTKMPHEWSGSNGRLI